MQRKINIKEIIIIATIIISGIIVFMLPEIFNQNGKTAIITIEGKVIKQINLKYSENHIFTLHENENITIEIKDSKIKVIHSDCPDKICCNAGFISKSNEKIICMPNKMIIEIIKD